MKYNAGCQSGSADDCASLATMYMNGKGGPRDFELARDFYVKACEIKAPSNCNEAGKLASQALGGPRDFVYAIGAFTRGCDAGDKKACMNIAVHRHHGLGLVKNEVAARASYKMHCETDKIAAACHNLAGMMLRCAGGEQDESGMQLYQTTCDGGYKASCDIMERRKKAAEKAAKERASAQ